ncbi:MAG: TVP38/TMEM64 family protein [Clostridia bacterium]|nr:TVP38/TMEM64 family protein [Clostridia bacterium]
MKKALKILLAAVIAAAVILLTIKLFPLVLSLSEPDTRESFRAFIESLGALGMVVMLLLQVLQIIVAVIPGEPIEILMGLMYGTVGGLLLTLAGILIGQCAVFVLIRRYGISFARRFVNVDKFRELSFLRDDAKRDSLIFLLFFIPGTPKDVLTYFAPFTGIPMAKFLVLATLARIPSIISSTWAGASLGDGDFAKTIAIFAITGAIGIGGILVNRAITRSKTGRRH